MDAPTPDTPLEPAAPLPSPGDPPIEPNLAIAGVTKAVCRECGETVAYNADEDPITTCPTCGHPLTITAATGHTAEEAIARAAQALPERVERSPHQPLIPGLRPAFDHASANALLFDCIDEIDRESEKLTRRKEDFEAQRKIVAALAEKRDRLLHTLRDRARDARYEGTPPATPDAAEPANAIELQQLLQEAGASVLLGEIESWPIARTAEAAEWARQQLAATAKAAPGTTASVRWPAFLAEAALNHTNAPDEDEVARPPRKGHPTRQAAARATQTAAKAAHQASAPERHRGRQAGGNKATAPQPKARAKATAKGRSAAAHRREGNRRHCKRAGCTRLREPGKQLCSVHVGTRP